MTVILIFVLCTQPHCTFIPYIRCFTYTCEYQPCSVNVNVYDYECLQLHATFHVYFFVSHEAINTYWLSLRAPCHQNCTDWFLEHHAIKTAHLAYSNFTDSQLLKSRTACMIHVLQYNLWLCLPYLSFMFTAFPLSLLSIRDKQVPTPTLQIQPQN